MKLLDAHVGISTFNPGFISSHSILIFCVFFEESRSASTTSLSANSSSSMISLSTFYQLTVLRSNRNSLKWKETETSLLKLPCWMVYHQACHQLSSNRQLGIQIPCPAPQLSTNLLYQGVVALLHGWVLFSWMHSNQARKRMAAP